MTSDYYDIDIDYTPEPPPERMFESTFTAFQDFQAAGDANRGIGARVITSPTGWYHQVVALTKTLPDGTRQLIKFSGPLAISGGDTVAVARSRADWTWSVTVNGVSVLTVTDAEIWPAPKLTRSQRWRLARRRIRAKAVAMARKVGDPVAHKLGYSHDDERNWYE